MKIWCTFLLCSATTLCFSQNHNHYSKKGIISPKKVLIAHNKWSDSFILPVVSAKYPQLNKILSEKKILDGSSLKKVIKEFRQSGFGITSMDYNITFENDRVISMIIYGEWMGAYPSSYQDWINIDIKTGNPYKIEQEITSTGLNVLLQTYKEVKKKEVQLEKKGSSDSEEIALYNELINSYDTLSLKTFFKEYHFTPSGVYFTSPSIFPHVSQAYDGDHTWFVPFADLKKYKKDSAVVLR